MRNFIVHFIVHFIVGVAGMVQFTTTPARAGTLSEISTAPFGQFDGVEYVIHTGRFDGTTSLGEFSVPFEVVAPADPAEGNGAVLFEPPHFSLRTGGRDLILGRGVLFDRGAHFLFEHGFAHAAVGFGDFGLNILDPEFEGLTLAGAPVDNPGVPNPVGQTVDDEILVQFVEAMDQSPEGQAMVGAIEYRYSFGVSQSSAVLLNLLLGPDGQGLFDYSMVALRFWPEPAELGADIFTRLAGEFDPPPGIGKVMFIQTESELVRTDAEQLRLDDPDFRTYEAAGAPHSPAPPVPVDPGPPPTFLNTLDITPAARALFAAGDDWVRTGTAPPPSAILTAAPEGQVDPVYDFETGIARDANLNALGGIRFPDLSLGRTWYIASAPFLDPDARFPGMLGLQIDLTCVPRPDGPPRFRNHGQYVSRYAREINRLARDGFLLEADAEFLMTRAAESDVGKPRTCLRDDLDTRQGRGQTHRRSIQP